MVPMSASAHKVSDNLLTSTKKSIQDFFEELRSVFLSFIGEEVRVGVGILNFNQPKETLVCIQRLFKSLQEPSLVIVIDNGSRESLESVADISGVRLLKQKRMEGLLSGKFLLYQIKDHFVLLGKLKKNLGFCGGNNLMLRLANLLGLRYFLFLNNDAWFEEGTIEQLQKTAQSFRAFAVSPLIKETNGKIWYAGGRLFWYGYSYSKKPPNQSSCYLTEVHSGCAVLFDVKRYLAIEGMRESFFISLDEPELSRRILASGGRIVVDPQVVVLHKVGKTLGRSGSKLHDYFWTRNRLILSYCHNPFYLHWLFVAVYSLVKLCKWFFWVLKGENQRVKIEIKAFADFFSKNWWAGSLREELNALDFRRGVYGK